MKADTIVLSGLYSTPRIMDSVYQNHSQLVHNTLLVRCQLMIITETETH